MSDFWTGGPTSDGTKSLPRTSSCHALSLIAIASKAPNLIEPATPADYPALAALAVAAYEEFAPHLPPGSWELMRPNLCNIAERAKTTEFLVVRDDGRIVASVGYCRPGDADPSIFPPHMAAIMLLAVHPSARRRGLAKRLVDACIERARRDRAPAIGLFTSEMMTSARRLYQSLGFQEDGDLPSRYGVRRIRLVLPLESRTSTSIA